MPSICTDARVGSADAGDHVQQRGLAAAAAAHQHHLFAGGDAKFLDVQDRQRTAVRLAKRLANIFEMQHDRSILQARGTRQGAIALGPIESSPNALHRIRLSPTHKSNSAPRAARQTQRLPVVTSARLGDVHGPMNDPNSSRGVPANSGRRTPAVLHR